MLDPVFQFFTRVFQAIGRGIRWFIAMLVWPFTAFWAWLNGKGWFVKIPVFAILALLVFGYGYLLAITQFWSAGDPARIAAYQEMAGETSAGESLSDGTCQQSAMVLATADLIDFNVNDSTWVPSNPLHKAGFFFIIDWKDTPFLDNRAAFQLGVNQSVRRTAVELVDRLGRVRGTSSINQNLQQAREAANYRENAWVVTLSWPFLQPSTPNKLREARRELLQFNEELSRCQADFDARSDNLLQFLDRVTSDLGSTSDILQRRMEQANFTGIDRRADDRFWFTYGQLYGYYAILTAARADFSKVFELRNLDSLWARIDEQLREALSVRPLIVVNGSASSILKSHLESIGVRLLRVRANLVEMRDVLDR